MKLSKKVLDQGRALIVAKRLDDFKAWHDNYIPAWSGIDPRASFEKAYKLGMDGTKLFDALYSNVDPKEEMTKLILSALKNVALVLILLLVILGSIGGIVYLLN